MSNAQTLTGQRCQACEGGVAPLSAEAVQNALAQALPEWSADADHRWLRRRVTFDDFGKALAFTNAVGWVAEQEGHHPDLQLGWGYCEVALTTHAIGGLSQNDLICAAKFDALLDPSS